MEFSVDFLNWPEHTFNHSPDLRSMADSEINLYSYFELLFLMPHEYHEATLPLAEEESTLSKGLPKKYLFKFC